MVEIPHCFLLWGGKAVLTNSYAWNLCGTCLLRFTGCVYSVGHSVMVRCSNSGSPAWWTSEEHQYTCSRRCLWSHQVHIFNMIHIICWFPAKKKKTEKKNPFFNLYMLSGNPGSADTWGFVMRNIKCWETYNGEFAGEAQILNVATVVLGRGSDHRAEGG